MLPTTQKPPIIRAVILKGSQPWQERGPFGFLVGMIPYHDFNWKERIQMFSPLSLLSALNFFLMLDKRFFNSVRSSGVRTRGGRFGFFPNLNG